MNDLFKRRYSPRKYALERIDPSLIDQVFESARWAQSSFNDQPWRFVIATPEQPEFRARLEGLLAEGNEFAREAWVLGIAFGTRTLTRNGKPNRHHGFDTGAACQLLALAAFERGLGTRFMGGFDVEAARKLGTKNFEPWAMFVLGKPAGEGRVPPTTEERARRPLSNYLFRGVDLRGAP